MENVILIRRYILVVFLILVLLLNYSKTQAGKFFYSLNEEPLLETNFTETSTSNNEFLKRAIELKNNVQTGNYNDIQLLLRYLKLANPTLAKDQSLDHKTISQTIERLQLDKRILTEYKKEIDLNSKKIKVSVPLATSLNKFIGQDSISGIYDDCIQLLLTSTIDFQTGEINKLPPKGNQITVLKNTLIYLYLVFKNYPSLSSSPELVNELQLLYPAELPAFNTSNEQISTHSLCFFSKENKIYLQIPNSGYVFGGVMFGDTCKGVDCSAYLSYAVQSSQRLITEQMEQIWKQEMQKKIAQKEVETTAVHRGGFLRSTYVPSEFEAIDIANGIDVILKGDLIVWRTSVSGHVVMFINWKDKEKLDFYGIEAQRADVKTTEGLGINVFNLNKFGYKTYVLRRTVKNLENLSDSNLTTLTKE